MTTTTTATAANTRVVADVWEKDVWEFEAKSASSGFCRLFLHFLGKIVSENRKGGTASLCSRTRVKRNAVFGARLRVFLCIFFIKEGI